MARKSTFLIFLLAVMLVASLAFCFGEDDMPDFSKMRVKELKKLLDERGVECVGCVEKDHLVSRVKETYHLPVLSEEQRKERAAEKSADTAEASRKKTFQDSDPEKNKYNDADMQKIIDELKKSGKGFENMKMYTPEDLKKFELGDFYDKEEL